MAGLLVTLSGASGTGKTECKEALLKLPGFSYGSGRMTREYRSAELSIPEHLRENVRMPLDEFLEIKSRGEFLWASEVYPGQWYGTGSATVDPAFDGDARLVMVLTPNVLPILRDYAGGKRRLDRLVHLYFRAPNKEEQERRLRARGESDDQIKKRLEGDSKWDEEALRASRTGVISYTIIDDVPNAGDRSGLDIKVARVRGYVQSLLR